MPTRCSTLKKVQLGFTLVELMVVIAVIAVIAGIAAPSFQGLMNSSRITSATNDVIAGIQNARMESIRTNGRAIFCRATAAAPTTCAGSTARWTHWVSGLDANSDNAIDTVLGQGVFPTQVVVRNSSNIANSTLVFRPDGFARQNDGTLLAASFEVCVAGSRPNQNASLMHIASGSRLGTERVRDAACTATVAN